MRYSFSALVSTMHQLPLLCRLTALVALSISLACQPAIGSRSNGTPPRRADAGADAGADMPPPRGTLEVLAYNVAGLPEGISGSNPETYMPLIAPLLSSYELVLVQEDFCYHEELLAGADHPYISLAEFDPGCTLAFGPGRNIGDGLNRFSRVPFDGHARGDWLRCHGRGECSSDCLTDKGFTVATHRLAEGVEVDVYNLHMDAGSCDGDLDARALQVDQLIEQIQFTSPDRALVVAGDTNLKVERPTDAEALERLLGELDLRDACREVSCGDERIDRIMVRSSDELELEVFEWSIPDEFVDEAGQPLSDHDPVLVRMNWRAR